MRPCKRTVFLCGALFCSGLGLLLPEIAGAQAGRKQVREGNKLYSEKKYDEANNRYQDALLENPASPLIQYNVGNVLYQKKNYEKALEAYSKSMDFTDVLSQSLNYYNLGNALYRSGKLPESIQAYEQALKLNPDDEDAKYNLEYVRNKLKENAEPQQGQEGQQGQEDQQKQEPKPDKNQDQNQAKEEQGAEAGEQDKKAMSKEDAERLLNALNENQKDLKKKQVPAGRQRVKKDW